MRVLSKGRGVRKLPAPQLVTPVPCHVRVARSRDHPPISKPVARTLVCPYQCLHDHEGMRDSPTLHIPERPSQFALIQACAALAPSNAHAVANDR